MAKKQDSPIGYRPSEEAKDFIEKILGENAVLTKTQIVEIAVRLLMSKDPDELDAIIGAVARGKWDVLSSDREKASHSKKSHRAIG